MKWNWYERKSKLKNITIQNWDLPIHPFKIYLYILFTYDKKHTIQSLVLKEMKLGYQN
jgi:hypothetical protein